MLSSRFAHARFHPFAPTKRGPILLARITGHVNHIRNCKAAVLKYADRPSLAGFLLAEVPSASLWGSLHDRGRQFELATPEAAHADALSLLRREQGIQVDALS